MNIKNVFPRIFTLFKKNYKFFLLFLLIIVFPLLVHIFFKMEVSEDTWTVAIWKPEAILEYGSTIISSLIVYFTVILTIKKNKEENNRILQNSQLEKKFDKYTKYASKILVLIPELIDDDFLKVYSGNFDPLLIIQEKQKLSDKFTNLQLKINQLQLYIPVYMRKYFEEKYMKRFNELKNSYSSLYWEIDEKEQRKNFNLFDTKVKEFFISSQQYYLLFSDYFFNEDMFIQQPNNIGGPIYPIDEKYEQYKKIKIL